jgi:hypothetical protein
VIDRTTATSWLRIPIGYLPEAIRASREVLNGLVPVFDQKGIEIGPIPAGTPVDLLQISTRCRRNRTCAIDWPMIKRWSKSWRNCCTT